MSVSCELCRDHLGEILEAEIRQSTSHLDAAPPNPITPTINALNGAPVSGAPVSGDAELSATELAALRTHIESCAPCVAQLDQMRDAHRALRALPVQSAPAELRARVRAQIAATKPVETANAAAIAIVPARNGSENLWQRTQRGWSTLLNRPARTAWMGGSLAIGALGIFLLVRLPEWSSTQSAQEVVNSATQNSDQNQTTSPNAAPVITPAPVAPGGKTVAPKNAAPKTVKPPQVSAPQNGELKPPDAAPMPAFPSVGRDNSPAEFVAPPLPALPPVKRFSPTVPNVKTKPNAGKVAPTQPKNTTNAAPKATFAPKTAPTKPAPTLAEATTAAGNAPTADTMRAVVPRNVVPPTVAVRTPQREVISLRVAALNSASDSANRVAPAPTLAEGGSFMESEKADRGDNSVASDSASTNDAPSKVTRSGKGMLRANNRMASKSIRDNAVTPNAQAREVTIEVMAPRDLPKARLMVTLAPDWQFSDLATKANSQDTNDASLQREVWKGSANNGQAVRVTVAIQPHFTLDDDNKGGTLRAGRNPLVVELWDVSGPTRKLIATRRLELPAENDAADAAKKSAR